MNTKPTIRIVASAAVVVGLLGGVVTPVVAQPDGPRAVAAKTAPLMNKDCHKAFRKDLKGIRREGANIWQYHEEHFISESVIYDGMRVLLADPNAAPELIAQQKQGASQYLSIVRPIVAKERTKAYKNLDAFEARFLDKDTGCLGKNGRKAFREGVRSWRSALKAVYAAHEHLFEMNQAVTALKIDQAFEQMQADEQEMATVEGKVEKAEKQFDALLGE